MKIVGVLILIITITMFSNCGNHEHENKQLVVDLEDQIYNNLLFIAIDSITKEYNLKNKILIYHDFYPDSVKYWTIGSIIKNNATSKNYRIGLLKKLYKTLNDSVKLNVTNNTAKDYKFYYKKKDIEQVDFQNVSFFGTLNLTKIVMDKGRNIGCFYIAIQCGKDCGKGYVVIIKNKSGWKISEIIQVWE